MNSVLLLLAFLAADAAGPSAEVSTLAGVKQAGELIALSSAEIVLKNDKQNVTIPLNEVLDVQLVKSKAAAPPDLRRPEVQLVDGTRLGWTALSVGDRQASVATTGFGQATVPTASVANVRFGPLDPRIADGWKDLSSREMTQDMVVTRKGDHLDHLDGIVAAVDDMKIKFVLDGEEVALSREKVFGIVYARKGADVGKPVCEAATLAGDFIRAQSVAWEQGKFVLGLIGGGKLNVPGGDASSLDFSLGKVRYLSQMEPREAKYTAFFDIVWKYHRDRHRDGGPLRLGGKEYTRGLWIHSRTLLKYRLGGEYRRFQAVMGIDDAYAEYGDCRVVLKGDDKVLFEGDVRGGNDPMSLDLDVEGVREFEIFVDFGGGLDISDHLDLADAKVIK